MRQGCSEHMDRGTETDFDMGEEKRQSEADTSIVSAAEKMAVGADRRADVGNTIQSMEAARRPVEEELLQNRIQVVG